MSIIYREFRILTRERRFEPRHSLNDFAIGRISRMIQDPKRASKSLKRDESTANLQYSTWVRGMIGIPSSNASVSLRPCLASFGLLLPRGLQHGVGLPHTRGHAEENLQLAAGRSRFLALHARENRIRIRPFGLAHAAILRGCRFPASQKRRPKPTKTL